MIALLRGVTPTGRNSIPKISYCAEILENSGLSSVKTYIQSGNIIFSTEKDEAQVQKLIHNIILEKIGANLSVIIKKKGQLENAINECPFAKFLDASRIHLVFTNDKIDLLKPMLFCKSTLAMNFLQREITVFICIFHVKPIKKF